jgi:hypothetical protein
MEPHHHHQFDPAKRSFLDLPGEIRNHVYKAYFTSLLRLLNQDRSCSRSKNNADRYQLFFSNTRTLFAHVRRLQPNRLIGQETFSYLCLKVLPFCTLDLRKKGLYHILRTVPVEWRSKDTYIRLDMYGTDLGLDVKSPKDGGIIGFRFLPRIPALPGMILNKVAEKEGYFDMKDLVESINRSDRWPLEQIFHHNPSGLGYDLRLGWVVISWTFDQDVVIMAKDTDAYFPASVKNVAQPNRGLFLIGSLAELGCLDELLDDWFKEVKPEMD